MQHDFYSNLDRITEEMGNYAINYGEVRDMPGFVDTEDLSEMRILIVDDSEDIRELVCVYLKKAGYSNILFADSATQAYQLLRDNEDNEAAWPESPVVDLILLDILMPEVSGVEACSKIRAIECYKDTPVIMVSAAADISLLGEAFSHGASDYIKKPIRKIELLARIYAALKLQKEMSYRKAWEKELFTLATQLKEANEKLGRLSMTDGLTEIANRRLFDKKIAHEWKRAQRSKQSLSLIMIDIDYFKIYNDTFGHQAGDDCLKQVAAALKDALRRPADFVARYGGEEFAAIIPEAGCNSAREIAEVLRSAVASLNISHHQRPDKVEWVTISLGVSSLMPNGDQTFQDLIAKSDEALYQAKHEGRNRVVVVV